MDYLIREGNKKKRYCTYLIGAVSRYDNSITLFYQAIKQGVIKRMFKKRGKRLFVFDSIKSLAKDSAYIGLANKSIRINGLDDLEDHMTLVFTS